MIVRSLSFIRGRLADGGTHSAEVKKGVVVAFAMQMGGVGLGFLLQVGLARWMADTAAYGRYATMLSLASILAVAVSLGLPQSVLRFVAAHRGRGDGMGARQIVCLARTLIVVCGLCVGGVIALVAWLFVSHDSARFVELLVVAAWVPLLALGTLYAEASRGEHRIFLALFFERIGRPALLLLGAGIFFRMVGPPTGIQVIELAVGILVLTVGVQMFFFHARSPQARLPSPAGHAHEPTGARVLLRVGLPQLLASGFLVAMGQVDTFLVGTMVGDAEAGVYSVASRISWIAVISMMIMNSVAAPTMAAMHAKGEHDRMARAVASFAHWSFWPSLACIIGIVCFDSVLLRLFGPDFTAARYPLIILLVGQLFNVGCGAVATLLNMTGHQDDVAKVLGVGAILNIGLNFAFIPIWGILGGAMATGISMAVWNIGLWWFVRKRLRLDASIVGAFRGGRVK